MQLEPYSPYPAGHRVQVLLFAVQLRHGLVQVLTSSNKCKVIARAKVNLKTILKKSYLFYLYAFICT
jgi:L-2-hydroxyglutarate oxidase LhgO